MTFITTHSPADAGPDVRAMYERQQARFGYLPNYARAFCHRPDVMVRWADLLATIKRHVDPRRFELVTLAAAHALKSSYCALAHGQALAAFYSADEVRAIAEGSADQPLSPAERALLRLARQVATDACGVSAADIEALRRHGLDDAEIFDVVAIAAARAFFAKVLDGLGVEPDDAYLALEPGVREALTVGRPIAAAEPGVAAAAG